MIYDDPLYRAVNAALRREASVNIPPDSPAVNVDAGTAAVVDELRNTYGTRVNDLQDFNDGPIDADALQACVECGSYWFELKRDRGQFPVGLALSNVGAVVGYAGILCCIECGKRHDGVLPT